MNKMLTEAYQYQATIGFTNTTETTKHKPIVY